MIGVGLGLVYAASEGWGRGWCMQLGKGWCMQLREGTGDRGWDWGWCIIIAFPSGCLWEATLLGAIWQHACSTQTGTSMESRHTHFLVPFC